MMQTVHSHPRVIAHRGLSGRFPENTMASYLAAMEAGAELVELDYYSTADGVLVCVHDPKLNRYLTPGAGDGLVDRRIGDFTLEELRRVDVGSWKGERFVGARIPTLEEVLAKFMASSDSPTLVLERKEGTVEQLLTLLDKYGAQERVVAQSFDWGFVSELHAAAPEIRLAALGGRPLDEGQFRGILETGARFAHWRAEALTAGNVRRMQELGLKVWAYTVNGEIGFRGAREMGLDGITTDWCDEARAFYDGTGT